MKRKIYILIAMLLPAAIQQTSGREIVSLNEDNYILTGASLRDGCADVKFQISLKVCPIEISPTGTLFFAYTQTTVWDAYEKSSPFRDNMYRPGVFFEHKRDELNIVTFGLEHRSNGRPYFGNPIASPTVEDYSRGVNYALIRWAHRCNGQLSLEFTARAGFGCGIGEYPRCEDFYTQDAFLNYIGYFDAKLIYKTEKVSASLMLTPIWNSSVANTTLNFSYRVNDRWPAFFAQFHYGYDEALCDCRRGGEAPDTFQSGLNVVT